ncbi:MAG TPA: DUF3325 domain-containing protein [Sandaracinaceae bacterium]
MSALALTLAYAGFTAVCLAMERHHRQLLGRPPARRTATSLRATGFVLLGLALAACLLTYDGSVGVILWLGLLTAAGLALVFLLPYAPRLAAGLAVGGPVAAALAAWAAG